MGCRLTRGVTLADKVAAVSQNLGNPISGSLDRVFDMAIVLDTVREEADRRHRGWPVELSSILLL